jgi:hypothetical protein
LVEGIFSGQHAVDNRIGFEEPPFFVLLIGQEDCGVIGVFRSQDQVQNSLVVD